MELGLFLGCFAFVSAERAVAGFVGMAHAPGSSGFSATVALWAKYGIGLGQLLIRRGRRGRLVQVEQCHWVPHVVRELILNQKKTAPEADVYAFSTAVFLWVGWFISGYGTPVSKTVQPRLLQVCFP